MKVVKITEDFEKDNVNVELDMTTEEQRLLMEKGFNQLLKEYTENFIENNEYKKIDLIELNRPKNSIYVGLIDNGYEPKYHLYVFNQFYENFTWYEAINFCLKLSKNNKREISFPNENEMKEIINQVGDYVFDEFEGNFWIKHITRKNPNAKCYEYLNVKLSNDLSHLGKYEFNHYMYSLNQYDLLRARIKPVYRFYV
ncbi:MAG: hypothetical protein K9L74_05635 [Candidatus Izimaplasma sp.]|nr:hypothetical protein [Candidatus Izimaplasma bacterium]